MPKVDEAKVRCVVLGGEEDRTAARPYVFKVVPSDILAVKKIFQHAKKAGISKIAILSASDGYGAGAART